MLIVKNIIEQHQHCVIGQRSANHLMVNRICAICTWMNGAIRRCNPICWDFAWSTEYSSSNSATRFSLIFGKCAAMAFSSTRSSRTSSTRPNSSHWSMTTIHTWIRCNLNKEQISCMTTVIFDKQILNKVFSTLAVGFILFATKMFAGIYCLEFGFLVTFNGNIIVRGKINQWVTGLFVELKNR